MDRRLYDEDFYLWTQEQAEALRRESARAGGSNAIDWELVAEEVGDLGVSERNRVFSLTAQVLVHLFKLAWTQRTEPRGHWKSEVLGFRADIRRALSPSLRRKTEDVLEDLHVEAAERASLAFESEEPAAVRDLTLRWTLAEVLGEERDPIR